MIDIGFVKPKTGIGKIRPVIDVNGRRNDMAHFLDFTYSPFKMSVYFSGKAGGHRIIIGSPKTGYRILLRSKTIQDGSCPDHPDARRIEDVFAYFTIDDGTGSMQCSTGSDQLLSFLKIGREAITNADGKGKDEIHAAIRNAIFGVPLIATGEFRRLKEDLSFRIETMKKVEKSDLKAISSAMEAEL